MYLPTIIIDLIKTSYLCQVHVYAKTDFQNNETGKLI